MKVVGLDVAVSNDGDVVGWFSGGVTSAIGIYLWKQKNPDTPIRIVYIDTGSHHDDHTRFLKDCEQKLFDQSVEILRATGYSSVFDVVKKTRYINGPAGARCTRELKVNVRLEFENNNKISSYIWGFENTARERNRADNMVTRYPYVKHEFPLIDADITKPEALSLLDSCGVETPTMYKLGYNNNNCIGCVKGGKGYWNKIRVDFPEVFDAMIEIESTLGRSCINGTFLKDLHPDAGRLNPIMPECDSFSCVAASRQWFQVTSEDI